MYNFDIGVKSAIKATKDGYDVYDDADSTLSRVDLDFSFFEDRRIMKDLDSYGT